MTLTDETTEARTDGAAGSADETGGGAAAVEEPVRPRSRARSALVGVLAVLTSIAIGLSVILIWAHQVALNTDRFVGVVGPVAQQPEVVSSVSDRLATQVVGTLRVEQRVASALPSQAAFLADPLTNAVTTRLEAAIGRVMASPQFHSAWTDASRVAHAQLVSLLRGSNDVAKLQGQTLNLNVVALVGAALHEFQANGFIPASVQLPDLSSGQLPAATRERLQSQLGVTLPPDFGTVAIADAPRLAAAQQAVHWFDVAVIVLPILAIILAVVTVLLAANRRGMIAWLGIGTAIALVVGVVAIRAGEQIAVGSLSSPDGAPVVRALVDQLNQNLAVVAGVVIVIALLVALLAWIAPRQAARTERRASGAAREA